MILTNFILSQQPKNHRNLQVNEALSNSRHEEKTAKEQPFTNSAGILYKEQLCHNVTFFLKLKNFQKLHI